MSKQLDKKPKKQPIKKPTPTWEEIANHVYERIYWYATRFILVAIIGVVIGVVGLIYAALSMIVYGIPLQSLSVFLGVFIGAGAIVVSIILLAWGTFWRKKADNRSIF